MFLKLLIPFLINQILAFAADPEADQNDIEPYISDHSVQQEIFAQPSFDGRERVGKSEVVYTID